MKTLQRVLLALLAVGSFSLSNYSPPSEAAGVSNATFTPLGFLQEGRYNESGASGISADGTVVVGTSSRYSDPPLSGADILTESFRWTQSDGLVGLGDLYEPRVSGDGEVVVGYSLSELGEEAVRWTASEGAVGLGDLPGLRIQSRATGVSHDGAVVVGYSLGEQDFRAFRWTADSGMVDLGDLTGGLPFSAATAVSADGNTVVGYSYTSAGKEAFIWTPDEGMKSLGDLPGGAVESYARGISADGKVVVGLSTSTLGYEAFRWTEETGMQAIGSCGGRLIGASSTTANGDRVMLSCVNEFGRSQALIWDEAHGVRDLYTVLVNDYGLSKALQGWQLEGAGVAADGKALAGSGTYGGWSRQAWVVNLPADSPIERAEELLNSFDEAIADGTLVGLGRGASGPHRANVLYDKLFEAKAHIEADDYPSALATLENVYKFCDGKRNPGDFVEGPARASIAAQVLELVAMLQAELT